MKIPYGESNFKTAITQNYVYIDKTNYITHLETAGKYLVLLRPRRFGKSLFISMLEHYYDVAYQADFETLFGHLAIGQNPTPLHNQYQVLFMDFSGFATDQGEEAIQQRFNDKLDSCLQSFLNRYAYSDQVIDEIKIRTSPAAKMEHFFTAVEGQKVLLLIDEYDHFANSILADDINLFLTIMGKGGFVRSFYETLKTATQRGTLDRLFITGVTPIMLDSMTSGFNIGENLSLKEDFNGAIGFTQAETESLLQPLIENCELDSTALLTDVKRWYNGYRFHHKATDSIYNADMVLYFIKNFDHVRCEYPEQMLDDNIASDYGKILGLFSIGNRDTNFAVLDELISNGEVSAKQRRKFDFEKGFDQDDFVSLLTYMGFTSLQGKRLTSELFGIPNQVMRELYFQYFKVELERRNQITIPDRAINLAIEALALQNNIQPLIDEVTNALQLLSNRDSMGMDEKHVKVLLLTLLYQTPIYFIQSEREINRKYPDILLLERSPFAVEHQHLIELKYSKKGTGESGWEAKRQEGVAQVEGYLQLPEISVLPKLTAWVLVTDGERVEVVRVSE